MIKRCDLISKKDCTGCQTCFNICPVNAISMVSDNKGFLYPKIDDDKCINCGLCYKRCPIIYFESQINTNSPTPLCYAFESKDKGLVLSSSSGGAFSTIAEYVLDHKGVVCGVTYNYESKKAEHILIEKEKELYKLRTSKYVQSDVGAVYKAIKKHLESGKMVLFTGCGCQVAGLKAYLNKSYNNLLLVDIVCHGVPSTYVLNKYIECFDSLNNLEKINFREKKQYGWTPTMDIQFKSGKEVYLPKWESEYYKIFLGGIGCRLSCGNCRFNKLPRQGDLTIADFWDIAKYDSRFEGTKGTSLVLFNNEKYLNLKDLFKKKARLFEEEDLNIERKTNGNIFASSATNRSRERFFHLLKKYNFIEATSRTINRHFEIGLVGWWYGHNYGSFLTYYALNRWLIENDYDVLMLSWPHKSKPFPPRSSHYVNKLADEYYDFSIDRTFAEYPNINRYCDIFMIGSDQMWNYWDQKGMGYYYFLDFVDDTHPRLSYSTSFGHKKYMAKPEEIEIQKKLLHKFNAISVRENDGVDICKNYFDINATRTIDPVFLADTKYYEELIAKNPTNVSNKYLFCYILTPTKEKGDTLKQIAEKLGLELVIALDGQTSVEENREKLGIENVQMNLNVSQWLSFIKNADYVITDSFHGVCFSIIYRKQFACMINAQRGTSRFDTLFDVLNLKEHAFNELTDLLNSDFNLKIDYVPVFDIIQKEKEFSEKWLRTSLDNCLKIYKEGKKDEH